MSSLKFTVKEDGELYPVCQMSTHDAAAIEECIDALLPAPASDKYWFVVETCIDEEDDEEEMAPYGLVKCVTFNKEDPVLGVLQGNNDPYPLPEELINAISGKTFTVYPIQYGVNPWGKKVEIIFESCPPPKPKGVKASALIAAALKA